MEAVASLIADKHGRYLRVKTPVTSDGLTPKMDEDDKMIFKTTELPYTAQDWLKAENANLPKALHHRIEVIGENHAPNIPSEKLVQQNIKKDDEIAELRRQLAALQQSSEDNQLATIGKKEPKAK